VAKRSSPELEVPSDDGAELRDTMGRRVRVARRMLDLTQGDLGERFGRTHGWVASIEKGKAYPPPFLLVALRKATGQPFGWFYGEGPDFPTATPGP
jgi:transcriptional regulator with XRE-family HTH domain